MAQAGTMRGESQHYHEPARHSYAGENGDRYADEDERYWYRERQALAWGYWDDDEDAGYRRKGPPALPMRVLGPFVILTSLAVIGTGIILALTGPGPGIWLLAHKAAFVLWF